MIILQDVNTLLEESITWYQKRFSIRELKNSSEIITPFVNHLNDRICLYVEFLNNGDIRLSDDGVTLDELSMAGIDMSIPTRQKILKDILRNYGLTLSGDIILVEFKNSAHFPQMKYNLIQGLLSVYDILFTSKHYATGIFNEEVLEYFFENDFGGTPNPKLLGNSGITHQLDYSIGATKKRPHTLMKFLNTPSFTDVVAQQYISNDLKSGIEAPKISVKYVIIGNDQKRAIPEKSIIASEDMGIELIPWSNKDKILSLK